MAVGAKAVFLDKDGTLVRDVPFNDDPAKVSLLPGVGAGLRQLAEAGFALIVVTNQSGLARGLMTEPGMRATMRRMSELLAAERVSLHGIYVCPHHPAGVVPGLRTECDCRKPRTGLLRLAAAQHDIDFAESWLVGDILDDVEAGGRAGCRTVLLTGGETEWLDGAYRTPDAIVTGFMAAAEVIVREAAAVPESRIAL
jgi:D,D-heptose 1,7-bisphosphate phosphatase